MKFGQKRFGLLLFLLNFLFLLLSFLSSLLYSLHYFLLFGQIFHLHGLIHLALSFSLVLLIPLFSLLPSLFKELPLLVHIFNIVSCYFSFLWVKGIGSGIHVLCNFFTKLFLDLLLASTRSLPTLNCLKTWHLFIQNI